MLAHLSPKERMIYVGLALLMLVFAGYVGVRNLKPVSPIVITENTAPPPSPTPTTPDKPSTAEPVVVHVAGAVKNPGVYSLKQGQRVEDAIRAASGFTKKAQPEALNLAAKLQDGTQIFVPPATPGDPPQNPLYQGGPTAPNPYKSVPDAPSHPSKSAKTPTSPVNLNTATADQLQSIPGIGPSTADRILAYKKAHGPFKTLDELTAVGGIGQKKLTRLRPWLHL